MPPKDSSENVFKKILDEVYRRGGNDLPERRQFVNTDHDLLTRIDEKVSTMLDRQGIIERSLADHKIDDTTRFNEIKESINKIGIKIAYYSGGIVVSVFLIKLVFKL